MPTQSAEYLRQRAKRRALIPQRQPDDPEIAYVRRHFAAETLRLYVERVLVDAPPLTDEQRTRLAELLKPIRQASSVDRAS